MGGGEVLPLVTESGHAAGEVYLVRRSDRSSLTDAERQSMEHCLAAAADALLVAHQAEATASRPASTPAPR
jgi:hypothetical protein